MQSSRWRRVWITFGLVAVTALAQAAEPVTNTLSVHRIVKLPDGGEKLESAQSAKPGDQLEYVAELHNNSGSTARGLSATLPLPVGTELIAASQRPITATASLDGQSFQSLPLKRVVKQSDGTSREELVPLREYRFLRWPATELGVGGAYRVSARVAISSTDQAR